MKKGRESIPEGRACTSPSREEARLVGEPTEGPWRGRGPSGGAQRAAGSVTGTDAPQ